jgi:hypothetical protein
MGDFFVYLNLGREAFFASIALFTAKRFLVLCERLDFFLGLRVVPLFAI